MPPRTSLRVMQYRDVCARVRTKPATITSASATESTKNDIATCDRSNTSCCQNTKNGAVIINEPKRLMPCHNLWILTCVTTVLSSQNIHAHSSPQFKDFVHLGDIVGG